MSGTLRILFFLGDILLLNFSILLSFLVTHGRFWPRGTMEDAYLLVFSNLAWLFLTLVATPYNITRGWTVSQTVRSQLAFLFIQLLVIISLIIFFRQDYSIFQLGVMYLTFIPLFFASRVIGLYLRKVFTDEVKHKNYVFIGKNELSSDIRKFYTMNPEYRYRFLGYLDFDYEKFSIEEIQKFCVERNVHEIYCCAPDVTNNQLQQLINFGLNSLIKVKVVTATENQSLQLNQFNQLPGLDRVTIPLDEPRNQFFKRIFDLVFAFAVTLFVLSWLIPLVGLLIKLDSRGPVFFVQLRSGKDNRPFKCFKFRTMKVNAQADTTQASKGDPRITKLGHFLRKTSIDELPQFINVLLGSMSIVGPRPHMLRHTDEYSKLIEHFMGRHYIKPGITGLAQCMGYRGETKDIADMENRVRMDRYYIENWSFWFDIKIIFLTVISLIRGSDKAF